MLHNVWLWSERIKIGLCTYIFYFIYMYNQELRKKFAKIAMLKKVRICSL
jgi:hypothetical protein